MDDYRLAGVGAYLLVFCFSMDIGMLAHFIWRCFYKLHSTNGPSEKSPLFTILNSGFIKKQCCIQIELALARFEIHMCWKFTYSSINSNYSHHTIHPSNASFIWIIWMKCIFSKVERNKNIKWKMKSLPFPQICQLKCEFSVDVVSTF